MAKTGHGTYLSLPAGSRGPFVVYVNGDEQRDGTDFVHEGDGLRFSRPLRWARKAGLGATVMFTAGIGFYETRDTIDVHCAGPAGEPVLLAGVQVEAEE